MSDITDYDWCEEPNAEDWQRQEEAHYWFTICEFTDLIHEYGMERVISDVSKRRFQKYGSGDGYVLIAGLGGDKGTE